MSQYGPRTLLESDASTAQTNHVHFEINGFLLPIARNFQMCFKLASVSRKQKQNVSESGSKQKSSTRFDLEKNKTKTKPIKMIHRSIKHLHRACYSSVLLTRQSVPDNPMHSFLVTWNACFFRSQPADQQNACSFSNIFLGCRTIYHGIVSQNLAHETSILLCTF